MFQNSVKKLGAPDLNMLDSDNQRFFQKEMKDVLQRSVEAEYESLAQIASKQKQSKDAAVDTLMHKYKFLDLKPSDRYGSLSVAHFQKFLSSSLPEHLDTLDVNGVTELYKNFMKGESPVPKKDDANKPEPQESLVGYQASLDVEAGSSASDINYFSLRDFVFTVLFSSPVTVKEKLDIQYDIINMANTSVDGIDVQDAITLYQSILKHHLYSMPYNEITSVAESAFTSNGDVGGIVAAYWTRRKDAIRYDMDKSEGSGVVSYEAFVNSGVFSGPSQVSAVDLSKELLATFQMY